MKKQISMTTPFFHKDKPKIRPLSLLKLLLKTDLDGDRGLHLSVLLENIQLVTLNLKILQQLGLSINMTNRSRQTALHVAAIIGNSQIIKLLLDHQASLVKQDRWGNTPIHIAVTLSHNQCLKEMMEAKPISSILDCLNFDGYAALHQALFNNNFQALETLVQVGANIDVQDGKSGRTALFHATTKNNNQAIKMLVALSADIYLPDFSGLTPYSVMKPHLGQDIICKEESQILQAKSKEIKKLKLEGIL